MLALTLTAKLWIALGIVGGCLLLVGWLALWVLCAMLRAMSER